MSNLITNNGLNVLRISMRYNPPVVDHETAMKDWLDTFAECKSKGSYTRKLNSAIAYMTEHLSDIKAAVAKDGWHHGYIYTMRHVRLAEKELAFLIDLKAKR